MAGYYSNRWIKIKDFILKSHNRTFKKLSRKWNRRVRDRKTIVEELKLYEEEKNEG